MMANNFTKPLLLAETVDREINAIESRYQKAMTDDTVRITQTLQENCSNKDNILNRFIWGNIKSLTEEKEDELLVDLRAFFDKQYSADRMKLVI